MKIWKIAAVVLFMVVLLGASACSLGQSANAQSQVEVAKGDLTVKVNGTGKTGYANDANLSFGTAGRIAKVAVKKGDAVTKGTLLAQLETGSLELSLSQAKLSEAAAGVSLTQAEMAVTQAQEDELQTESAITQAEVSLAAAQMNLDKTQAVKDIKDEIMAAQMQVEAAKAQIAVGNQSNTSDLKYWTQYLVNAQADVARYQSDLAKLLAKDQYAGIATYELEIQKYDELIVDDVQLKEKQVEAAQQAVDMAKQNTAQAQQNIVRYQQNVDQANLSLAEAGKVVEVAQKQLDYASIVAPFDGVVAGLDFKTGDFFTPGLTAGASIYLVDSSSLETNADVDEVDIAGVKVGQKALISLDALPGDQFDGLVDSISIVPATDSVNQGVVLYTVKVKFAGNPPAGAKSGMSASTDVITHESKDAILVPNKSIKRNSQGQTVVDLVVNQKIEERPVTLGLTDGNQTEIISGLQAGDRIVKLLTDNSVKSG
jgi:HlyD family secretion protein